MGFNFTQGIHQVIDNFTWVMGSHAVKAGVDAQFIGDDRVQGDNFLYTFPTIDAYLQAKSGVNPYGYTSLAQTFGQMAISYKSRFYGAFVQDDWQITPRVLTEALHHPDRAAAKRAFDAMMTMRKIDVATIEAALRG